jgi:signal transduction histidine kinase
VHRKKYFLERYMSETRRTDKETLRAEALQWWERGQQAQRRAAWSEIARRMAHEIKNPLTPIRLSAERLARNLLRGNGHRPVHRPVHLEDISNATSDHTPQLSEREQQLVRECTTLISDEVTALILQKRILFCGCWPELQERGFKWWTIQKT